MEKQETIWMEKIKAYEDSLNIKLSAPSAVINVSHNVIQDGKLLSLDDEDEQFREDFNRVIDSEHVKHVDNLRIDDDNFIGMELGIRRGDDAKLDRGIVKKRAIGEDGIPMGV